MDTRPLNPHVNLRGNLRERAGKLLEEISPSERANLLIKGWMSHDARWFMAVCREFGMQVTNRINQDAVYETGKVEAWRISRRLNLPLPATVEDCMLLQEVLICFFGPDVIDYDVFKVSDDAYQLHVKDCFAPVNAARAGVADEFECGVFARTGGWLTALGVDFVMSPPLGKCMKLQGKECICTIRVRPGEGSTSATSSSSSYDSGLWPNPLSSS